MYRILGADGREYGPVTGDVLRQWIAEGRAGAQTWAQAAGATAWQPLGSLPEFAGAFAPARPPVAGGAPPASLPTRQTNSLATASLVMGLLAITCGCCCCYGFPFNLLGVVFALIALAQIQRSGGLEEGRGFAIAGLVLSLLSLALAVFGTLVGFLAALPEMARGLRRW